MPPKLSQTADKVLEDPLQVALKAKYNIEEFPTNMEMTNPQVLISPQLHLCLIAKDKVILEDLWTTREMDGNYILHLRAKYIEFWPRVFGENRNLILREEIVSLFRLMAQCYICFVPATGVTGEVAANALVQQCDFAIRRSDELCLQVQEMVISQVRGSGNAKIFRQHLQELDPKLFSVRAEHALGKVTRAKTGRDNEDTDEEGANKRPKGGGGGGKKGDGKGKRKCTRCKKGPFTFDEFKVHNTTCK